MKNNTATATTVTADPGSRGGYVGRFAPSPSGDLHLGSLYTAAASYLDARANRGRWLVRVEDLDLPRVVPGATAGILHTLQAFGFEWDGEVIFQSQHTPRYAAALEILAAAGLTFECTCSRAQLADEERYPGHCRAKSPRDSNTSTRLRVDPGYIQFTDEIQGTFRQDVAGAVGDFVLRRRDRIVAYVLAVVVDDAAQGVTHIVRGADLLDNTPRQIYLQRLLAYPVPRYSHVPVLTEANGSKLAKSARSVRVDPAAARSQLVGVFSLLGLQPPTDLIEAEISDMWRWAAARWDITHVPRRLASRLTP